MTILEWQTERARQLFIGQSVPIGGGRMGRIVSVSVTSDGFVIGHTKPGFDRGVFLGRVPKMKIKFRVLD